MNKIKEWMIFEMKEKVGHIMKEINDKIWRKNYSNKEEDR